MSISYKNLYQEAVKENARLQLAIEELQNRLAATREVVDLAGIAWHMKVERHTPQQWRQRGLLPEVDFPRIKEPLWYAASIREQFAEKTRRPWYEDPDREDLSPAA